MFSKYPLKNARKLLNSTAGKCAIIFSCTASLYAGTRTFTQSRPFYSSRPSYIEAQPYTAGATQLQQLSHESIIFRTWHHLSGLARLLAFVALTFYVAIIVKLGVLFVDINTPIQSIERLGPMYTKLCQWASTRPDLLTDRIITALQRTAFYSSVHSYEKTLEVLREENMLGNLIDHVDPEVVGSGSVAQVHRATYIPTGETVAVKVLHPKVEHTCLHDLDVLLSLAWLFDSFFQFARLYDTVLEFRQFMLSQFDLVSEAYNIDRFQTNFDGIREVSFPKVFFDATTHRVLTQEYIEGTTLSELIGSKDLVKNYSKKERKELARIGACAFFKMLLIDNFTHGDLHSGNIIIREKPPTPVNPFQKFSDILASIYLTPAQVSVVILDCGLAFRLSENEQRNFIALFHEIARKRFRTAAELFHDQASFSKCRNREAYISDMETVLQQIDDDSVGFKTMNFGSQLHQIWSTLRNHRIGIESKFTSLLSSLAVVEGVGKTLDSSLNIVATSLPFLFKRIALQGDSASSLVDLIVS